MEREIGETPRQHPGRTHDLPECSNRFLRSRRSLSLSLCHFRPSLPSSLSRSPSNPAAFTGNTTQGKPKMVTASALERRSIPRFLLVPLDIYIYVCIPRKEG